MQLKVNFLCRDSILAAPVVLDLVLFLDMASRAGMRGIQEWLSFYFKFSAQPFTYKLFRIKGIDRYGVFKSKIILFFSSQFSFFNSGFKQSLISENDIKFYFSIYGLIVFKFSDFKFQRKEFVY